MPRGGRIGDITEAPRPPSRLREFYSAELDAERRRNAMRKPAGYERIAAMFIGEPPADEIAAWLNTTPASVCPHGRAPCILRCGVEIARVAGEWSWVPMLGVARRAWLEGARKRYAPRAHDMETP